MKSLLLSTSLLLTLVAAPAVAAEQYAAAATYQVPATQALEPNGDGLAAAGTEPQAQPQAPDMAPQQPPAAKAPNAAPAYTKEDQPFHLRDYEEPKPAPAAPWWQQALGFVLKLAIVLGLIVGSLSVWKKVAGGKLSLPNAKGKTMAVLESTTLGPNQTLHLVSLGGERVLVVGATPQGISTLAEITDPAQAKRLMGGAAASAFNQVYDLESAGSDTDTDLFAQTLDEVGNRFGAGKKNNWPRA